MQPSDVFYPFQQGTQLERLTTVLGLDTSTDSALTHSQRSEGSRFKYAEDLAGIAALRIVKLQAMVSKLEDIISCGSVALTNRDWDGKEILEVGMLVDVPSGDIKGKWKVIGLNELKVALEHVNDDYLKIVEYANIKPPVPDQILAMAKLLECNKYELHRMMKSGLITLNLQTEEKGSRND